MMSPARVCVIKSQLTSTLYSSGAHFCTLLIPLPFAGEPGAHLLPSYPLSLSSLALLMPTAHANFLFFPLSRIHSALRDVSSLLFRISLFPFSAPSPTLPPVFFPSAQSYTFARLILARAARFYRLLRRR